jgi:drug/metabolite transporter (DMT)-like permease
MQWRRNGILFILISNIFFGFLPITVKWANQAGYAAFQVSLFRFIVALAGIALLASLRWQKIKPVNRPALFCRGFFGGATVLLYFIALQLTTAAKATLLNYTFSIWANVFDVLIFRRKPPRTFIPAILLAFCGTWLVLDVHWDRFVWGDLCGVFSGMTGGAALLAVKECRRTDNALTTFSSFSLFGLLIAALMLLFASPLGMSQFGAWTPVDEKGWLILAAMGLVAMVAQLFYTHAYGFARLADGALLSLLVPVLTGFFAMLFLQETLAPHFILGTLLILAGCGLLSWEESKQNQSRQK